MERILEYRISKADTGKTIKDYLQDRGFSRQNLVELKKMQESILLNGVWEYVTCRVKEGDMLCVHINEEESSEKIPPVKLPFPIIYEDEHIIALNKPANMPIHPSMNHHEGTLANGLMYYFQEKGEHFTFRCINRLDRDTSGLTIVAKHLLSAGILSRQVSAREIKRTYRAICHGLVDEHGTIDAPIARAADSTIERCVNIETGEIAITHYKRIAYDTEKSLSLVELHLETGRTHQIRVHMKYIGHPIIGDFLYNPDYIFCNRQALHSSSLDFIHPITKEEMHFASPLPEDLKCIFKNF